MKCPYAKKCSGCQLQNLTYEKQLQMKQVKLIKLLGKFAHVEEIIGMDNPYHYRNKAQYAFYIKNRKIHSGIYQSATQKIVPVDDCMLVNEEADNIIKTIKMLCSRFKIKPYNKETGNGLLRHVLVRNTNSNNEIMVVLVTSNEEFKSRRSFANELKRRHPGITTIIHNVNPTNTILMLGKKCETLVGEGVVCDELCGLKFRISPRSFYQVNHVQTTKLYTIAKEFADLTGNEVLIDAYCGTGTIGLSMADKAKKVIGVEINADAIEDAKQNAKLNSIENVEFFNADAGEFMYEMAKKNMKIDTVITDPPRSGCSIKFLKSILTLLPKRIVYISCNPETLARDLQFLTKKQYTVQKIQPVDMFPHTSHVETVALLSRQIDVHKMKLNSTPFEMIKSGEKTIELRLFDEKRQQIKAGDKIVFTNNANGETLNTTVVKLHRFDSFEELYKSLPLLKCGYTTEDVEKATPSDMEQYYSVEEQKKYGVVGIELCRPKQITDESVVCLTRK